MSDFAALWNTTDALQHYVATTKQWPRDWDALSASLASVDPAYSDGDISFAKDRVEINFGVEIGSPPRASGWCVRLKSGRMKPEQEDANKGLRDGLVHLKRLTDLNSHRSHSPSEGSHTGKNEP